MSLEDDPRLEDWVALVRAMPALHAEHPGKYVLWSNKLHGVFDTLDAALTAGYARFELDPFYAHKLRGDQCRSWAEWLANYDASNAEYASWDCAAICASDRNPQGGDANAAPGRSPESAVATATRPSEAYLSGISPQSAWPFAQDDKGTE